jgi:HEAT repeat protein
MHLHTSIIACILFCSSFLTFPLPVESIQRERFITVEGADLRAKMETAIRTGRERAPQTRFWLAYSFDVRPGVAVDPGEGKFRGSMADYDGVTIFMGRSNEGMVETRNLGVFLLYEPDGTSLTRVEIYNLDRQREYSGYPVYWLGRGGNEESLNFLRQLVTTTSRPRKLNERGVLAIALHDDPRVAAQLKNFVTTSTDHQVRRTAVYWIGHTGGETAYLADLVRNEQENENVRESAAHAIGISRDPAALNTLTELYRTIPNRDIRRKLIHSISINDNQDPAIDFLIRIAKTDADTEARKQAMFWLGHKVGEKTLGVLKETVETDANTEVQKHAVFVLSRRPKDEAVPLLIRIARTHAKPEVRKDAIFWLGRTGDERALAFFEELLGK